MSDTREPCGNEDCDTCYPLPRFKISTRRVQVLYYERTIKAATAEDALREYNAGTAWPSSYDEHYGDVIDEDNPVITTLEPRSQSYIDSVCYHNLPKVGT